MQVEADERIQKEEMIERFERWAIRRLKEEELCRHDEHKPCCPEFQSSMCSECFIEDTWRYISDAQQKD